MKIIISWLSHGVTSLLGLMCSSVSSQFTQRLNEQSVLNSYWRDLLFLTGLITLVNFLFLGSVPLFPPDEGRYAEIAREMVSTHQWLIPHLDGVIYLEKPPLSYWMNATIIQIFGESEWAIRSGSAILSMFCCLATYFTARRLYNRRVGILSALILSSSFLFFGMGHILTTDMPLTFFLSTSLYGFLLAFQQPLGPLRTRWLCLAYFMAGLAVMTKGLIGIVFPGLIIMSWIALTSQWKLLKQMNLVSGALIVLGVNLPWLLLVQKQIPDFFQFYFITQQFARYATPVAHREMAFGTYSLVFLLGLLPWVMWLPQSIKHLWPQRFSARLVKKTELYLLIWPAVVFLFFAASHSVLIPYLLPIVPPVAIIIGIYIDSIWAKQLDRTQQYYTLFFVLIGLVISMAVLFLPYFNLVEKPDAYWSLVWITIPIFLSGLILGFGIYRWSVKKMYIAILLSAYFIFIVGWSISSSFNFRSIKPLALTINQLIKKHPEAVVINLGYYHQDLPYYTKQIVSMVYGDNELAFGLAHQPDANRWLINDEQFLQQWRGNKFLYVIMNKGDYKLLCKKFKPQCYLLDETPKNVLVSNRPLDG